MSGDLMTYSSDIADTSDFLLIKRLLPAHTGAPLHWHDYIEFEIIVSGSAMQNYNGASCLVEAGSAYMMSYYDFHGITALTDVTLYSIHFTPKALHPDLIPFLNFNRFCCRFDETQSARILHLIGRLEEETADRQPFSQMIQQNILSEIVILMIRKSMSEFSHAALRPILQVLAYINENFRNGLTLSELADRFSFSPNYLGQLFKAQTKQTFHDYLNTVRLKYACSLLSGTSLSAKEIAFMSGYSSAEYFMYAFKKKMNMTPGEWRRLFTTAA